MGLTTDSVVKVVHCGWQYVLTAMLQCRGIVQAMEEVLAEAAQFLPLLLALSRRSRRMDVAVHVGSYTSEDGLSTRVGCPAVAARPLRFFNTRRNVHRLGERLLHCFETHVGVLKCSQLVRRADCLTE